MRTLNLLKANLIVLSVFLFGGTFYTQDLLAYTNPKISNYNVTRLSCKGSNDGKVELQISGGVAPLNSKKWDLHFKVQVHSLPYLRGLLNFVFLIA